MLYIHNVCANTCSFWNDFFFQPIGPVSHTVFLCKEKIGCGCQYPRLWPVVKHLRLLSAWIGWVKCTCIIMYRTHRHSYAWPSAGECRPTWSTTSCLLRHLGCGYIITMAQHPRRNQIMSHCDRSSTVSFTKYYIYTHYIDKILYTSITLAYIMHVHILHLHVFKYSCSKKGTPPTDRWPFASTKLSDDRFSTPDRSKNATKC